MGNIKFLNKTFRIYLLSSVVVLLIIAPIFYFSMIRLYIQDTDETLILYKKEFEKYYLPHFKPSDVNKYNRYNRDIKIEPTKNIITDTFFYKDYYDALDNENETYRVLLSTVFIKNKPYTFTARISLVENEDLIESIAVVFILLVTLLLTTLLFVTNRLSKKIWQPFRNTLYKLKSFDLATKQNISFSKENIEEFNELNHSLQKLIDKNTSIYNQQKTFIENASHELQTPLAILKSKLNLLLQNQNITSEQSEILSTFELSLARMSRINKNLLILAKIENEQFLEIEKIELTELINQTISFLSDYIDTKQLSIHKNFLEKLTIQSNKTLFEILINNLFINAIIHNTEKGKINIHLSNNTLTISNTGKSTLNEEKLFRLILFLRCYFYLSQLKEI